MVWLSEWDFLVNGILFVVFLGLCKTDCCWNLGVQGLQEGYCWRCMDCHDFCCCHCQEVSRRFDITLSSPFFLSFAWREMLTKFLYFLLPPAFLSTFCTPSRFVALAPSAVWERSTRLKPVVAIFTLFLCFHSCLSPSVSLYESKYCITSVWLFLGCMHMQPGMDQ